MIDILHPAKFLSFLVLPIHYFHYVSILCDFILVVVSSIVQYFWSIGGATLVKLALEKD